MAIYGNLSEFPFFEVIGMLGQRTGVLCFTHLRPFESVELHLERGQLQGLSVDGVPIVDASMAHSYLAEIALSRAGDFEFRKRAPLGIRQPLGIVVKDALLRGQTTGDTGDAQRTPSDHLPDPQTRFCVGAVPVAHLDAKLTAFWVKAQPSLLRGSSAERIAEELRLEVGHVQVLLYQLRTIGAIRPVRRIEETMPLKPQIAQTPPSPTQAAAAKPTLISKLLGALSFMRRAS